MNAAPISRRPLGCLKTALRQSRQQQALLCRSMATATATATSQKTPRRLPDHNFYQIQDPKTKKIRTAFAVYKTPLVKTEPDPKKVVKKLPRNAPRVPAEKLPGFLVPPSDPLPHLHAAQIARMDPTGARTALIAKTRQGARPGDILMVTHRRGGEPFSGVCMSIRRNGIDSAILLRNHLNKVGVEMWYKVYNKNVAGIEIVKRARKRARRARLTYLRQPKHDMGSVSEIVALWKKSRKIMSTRGGAQKSAQKGGKKAAGKTKARK
ncbi:translation protein SH3-like domain-containing protein [Podospora aff. communis PSN243]|uniref:Translation protein SH3-like domain-containing protein n=1 Tax=Podospora aff. communis PSN243 TaxID=3040156 RepID=A0AAV9GDW3_9PEZI|nr:translation protein SH3-like domain-containing protein [Podospora aff. communis PSN243]